MEDTYMLESYRVDITRGKYSPTRRATMHNLTVYFGPTIVARGQTASARRAYTIFKALDILSKQAGVILPYDTEAKD